MKLLTVSALLALATATVAMPADELQKRATCTFFGYTYPCASSVPTSTSITSTATATGTRNTTATATSPPSTGGASKYTSGSTANDISSNTGCTDLTVIFARGTSEFGNIGSVSGPPMFKQLLSNLGASSLTLQGVDYPASAAGNVNCGAEGGATMANLAKTILSRCPNTKIALSGYSQGACVVHNAVRSQGLDASKVSAVVLFGDPFNGQSVGSVPASKVLQICASGDGICDRSGSFGITGPHLSYGDNAAQAAGFIQTTSGL